MINNRRQRENIMAYKGMSDRFAYIVLQIGQKYRIQIIKCYAPTSAYTDEDTEHFYDEITKVTNEVKCQQRIIIGYFNAITVQKQDDTEEQIGNVGLGRRNARG